MTEREAGPLFLRRKSRPHRKANTSYSYVTWQTDQKLHASPDLHSLASFKVGGPNQAGLPASSPVAPPRFLARASHSCPAFSRRASREEETVEEAAGLHLESFPYASDWY